MTVIVLLILHLLVCTAIGLLMHLNRIKTRSLIFPAVICIPLWGAALLLLEEYEERRQHMGGREVGVEPLKIQDIKYKRIEVDENTDQEITVPLEEAIMINDAPVRRRLMMDILYRNPEKYIELLQKARMAEDTELTHYATTTMMEIQSRYEERISRYAKALERDADNRELLRKYRSVLVKYIASGLISGNILTIYRRRLNGVLEALCAEDPENRKYALERLQNRIALRQFDGMEEELKTFSEKWQEEEETYQLYTEYYWSLGRGDKIKEVLKKVEEEEIYLTGEGKRWYEFWMKRRAEEEKPLQPADGDIA